MHAGHADPRTTAPYAARRRAHRRRRPDVARPRVTHTGGGIRGLDGDGGHRRVAQPRMQRTQWLHAAVPPEQSQLLGPATHPLWVALGMTCAPIAKLTADPGFPRVAPALQTAMATHHAI